MVELSQYLQVGRQERKLFLMDSRHPTLHLTLSWNNPSGEIDLHLTRELPDKTKLYGSIAKLTKESITGFFSSVVPLFETEFAPLALSFLQNSKSVRPGWLGRKGYVILWLTNEEHLSWVTKFAHKKSKNRYRIYQSSINNLNHFEEIEEHLYEPAILHEIAARGERGWIQALRLRGRKRRRRVIIHLTYVRWPDGRVSWIPIDRLVLALRGLMKKTEDTVFKPLKESLREMLSTIYAELRLHELGIERDKFISL